MATDIPADELLYFNGINGATGDYGIRPMTDKRQPVGPDRHVFRLLWRRHAVNG